MTDQSNDAGTFKVDTPVYGIFECWQCTARRPIFTPPSERRGGERVWYCRVCRAKSSVKWLDPRITFRDYLELANKEAT